MIDEIQTVRDVILHMIEELARHAGHLDIARELPATRSGVAPTDHTPAHAATSAPGGWIPLRWTVPIS